MSNTDLSKLSALREFLSARSLDFISDIQANRPPPIDFALSLTADRIGDQAGRGMISYRQMSMLSKAIRDEIGIEVEWIVTPGRETGSLETALETLLENRFPGAVSSVFLSALNARPLMVWVVPNSNGTAVASKMIKMCIIDFLTLYNIQESQVTFKDGNALPSDIMILRRIKIHAPISREQLEDILVGAGTFLPHPRWLQLKLDSLRRKGDLIRSKTGQYSLTECALNAVPHGGSRSSSDVERALALGRRKW